MFERGEKKYYYHNVRLQRLALFRIIVLVVIVVGILIYKLFPFSTKKHTTNAPTSAVSFVSPSSPQNLYCQPKDIQAKIEMGHAAGSAYGILILENISKNSCSIIGNNTVQVNSSAKNITVMPTGTGQNTIMLLPKQMLFGKVHYPSGPQCQSGPVDTKISFLYAISPKETVIFSDQNGNAQQDIVTCTSSKIVTQIDMWYFSQTKQ